MKTLKQVIGKCVLACALGTTCVQAQELTGPLVTTTASALAFAFSTGAAIATELWKDEQGKEVEQQIAVYTQGLRTIHASLAQHTVNDDQRAQLLLQQDMIRKEIKTLKRKRPWLVRLASLNGSSIKKTALGAWIATGVSGAALLASAGWMMKRVSDPATKEI